MLDDLVRAWERYKAHVQRENEELGAGGYFEATFEDFLNWLANEQRGRK